MGTQAFAVLGSAQGVLARFFIQQDEAWLNPKTAGKDVQFDPKGRSYVDVEESRLYRLTESSRDSVHQLTLFAPETGVAVYGFSSADNCHRLP